MPNGSLSIFREEIGQSGYGPNRACGTTTPDVGFWRAVRTSRLRVPEGLSCGRFSGRLASPRYVLSPTGPTSPTDVRNI
jgi:hypothetical protein